MALERGARRLETCAVQACCLKCRCLTQKLGLDEPSFGLAPWGGARRDGVTSQPAAEVAGAADYPRAVVRTLRWLLVDSGDSSEVLQFFRWLWRVVSYLH